MSIKRLNPTEKATYLIGLAGMFAAHSAVPDVL